jgi:D-3-phosphoglycerate dehydrogenase / 2-oxoglutarate reductase
MKKILLLEGIHPGTKQRLETAGYKIETEKTALHGDALIQRAKGFQALGIRSKSQVSAAVLENLPDLEVIGCFCIGTDQVDLKKANLCGVPVFNAPYSNTRSVAELVISEMIALSRRLADRSRQMHQGVWQKSALGANEVRGKTLGIIGYGHIGSQLSVLAESMGLNVLFYDIIKKLPLGNARPCGSLQELLAAADFVTLHVPDTKATKNMITKNELQKMRQGSYLINASRGTVVNIADLAEALRSKHVAGAAIDVFPVEPSNNDELFNSELQELENVILTPHIGGSTEEAQEAIGYEVAESFIRFLKYGATAGAVNFPTVDVSDPQGARRLANVHKNVPGVLGAINSIISALGGNIVGQHLATDPHIGYLIMDLQIKDAEKALKQIKALDTSIRTAMI